MSTAANPWLQRRPLHYAHQGGALEAPSSTLFAMKRAVHEFGAQGLELDVHRTRDGHLVVAHDDTVDRTTNATGPIHNFTLAELRTLDNAYWWVPGHEATIDAEEPEYVLRGRHSNDATLGIPTLEEVLVAFPRTYLNFDIKEIGPVRYEAQLADTLRAYGRLENVIVASFHESALHAFSAHAPDIGVSFGPDDVLAFYLAVNEQGPMPTFTPNQVAFQIPPSFEGTEVITERFVTIAHERGLAIHAWTIDDAAQMRQLLDLGVDGIMTDRPSVCAEVLAARKL